MTTAKAPTYDAPAGNGLLLEAWDFSFAPNGSSTPTSILGKFVSSVTYMTGSIYLVQFATTTFGSLHAFLPFMQNAASGSGQGFRLEVDATNTNLSASGGPILALASVNSSGARADIAADANCRVGGVAYFSTNTTANP